ncbi:hypothetical protein LOTGIDRAFT_168278 [Lottia gigantea]|uniref:Uncharacterized protein n=1 Tax=Lottia gigantea TaxID=225164 RepID=V3ZVQ3_LOTGI|nr:hypothetical protein LOTGIDRAFT_168278 [Lottia gigantea]ESO85016.1 hypothetical protein LOTGIDRAFT_168278 [Lottia gigantea]
MSISASSYSGTFKLCLFIVVLVAFSSYCGFVITREDSQFSNHLPKLTSTNVILEKLDSLRKDFLKQRTNVAGQFKNLGSKLSELVLNKNTKPENQHIKAQDEPWRKSTKTGLTLFTSWVDVPEKDLVHGNVVRMWRKWKPLIKPLFFYSSASTGKRLEKEGWLVQPVSKTGCGVTEMPTIKDMFLDAMKNHESVLYGYANGDITFDDGMPKAIDYVVNMDVVREKPVLVLVRRTNVDFSNGPELDANSDITEMYNEGKALKDGSSDGFFTNKLFPWKYLPDIVIGRIGIGMWLASYARAMNVTVIDITKTVKAIHMTTKSGNSESHFKKNGRCNHVIYGRLKLSPTSWGCGFITCATIDITFDKQGQTTMRRKNPKSMNPKCGNCSMDLTQILPKSLGITDRIYFGQNIEPKQVVNKRPKSPK